MIHLIFAHEHVWHVITNKPTSNSWIVRKCVEKKRTKWERKAQIICWWECLSLNNSFICDRNLSIEVYWIFSIASDDAFHNVEWFELATFHIITSSLRWFCRFDHIFYLYCAALTSLHIHVDYTLCHIVATTNQK